MSDAAKAAAALTPEMLERIRATVMTFETLDGVWVLAEDYAALLAERARDDAVMAQMAEALLRFAAMSEHIAPGAADHWTIIGPTAGDLRRARAALAAYDV